MSFANATRYTAIDVPLVDALGRDSVVAIVKATFDVASDGSTAPAERGTEVRLNDVPHDPEAEQSSIRYPTDLCLAKQGCDIVVVGNAMATKPAAFIDVAVSVADLQASLRVHGPRVFYEGPSGVTIGKARPFTEAPLIYELAYGGAYRDEEWFITEERNPLGLGFAKKHGDLVGQPAPRIEHPLTPHTGAGDKHPPMGFGAIATHWLPRRGYAGTFDQSWEENRMPLMPDDFDLRFNNVAHPSLQRDKAVTAGETVAVSGMSLDGPLSFQIPSFPVEIRADIEQLGIQSLRPAIDTLIIEPEARRFELVARATFPTGRGKHVLRQLVVDSYDDT